MWRWDYGGRQEEPEPEGAGYWGRGGALEKKQRLEWRKRWAKSQKDFHNINDVTS